MVRHDPGGGVRRYRRTAVVLLAVGALAEIALIWLGQAYGSTPIERRLLLLDDDVVPNLR